MAKQLHPSDFAKDRPEKEPAKQLTDSGQMASVPPATPEAKAAATRYLTRKGHGDLPARGHHCRRVGRTR